MTTKNEGDALWGPPPQMDSEPASASDKAEHTVAHRAPGRVAAMLRAWLRLPDVVADPEQTNQGLVWTRAQDVLPGVVVRAGSALTAAWGDQVWTVWPVWDEDDVEGLWLENLDRPTGPPRLKDGHSRTELLQRLRQSNADEREAMVSAILDDFSDCLTVTARAHRRLQHGANALLDDLERLAPSVVNDLDDLPSGQNLRALARRPTPSQQRWP